MSVNEVITRWNAEERTVRARLNSAATISEADGEWSGMDLFDAIFDGDVPPAPIGNTLDFAPIHVEPGRAVFQGRRHRKHYHPMGIVHGGWFATLLDSAVGCAVHATLPAGKRFTTL